MTWSGSEKLSGLLAGENACSRRGAVDFHYPNRSPIGATTSNQKDYRCAQKCVYFHNLNIVLAQASFLSGTNRLKEQSFSSAVLFRFRLPFLAQKPLIAITNGIHNNNETKEQRVKTTKLNRLITKMGCFAVVIAGLALSGCTTRIVDYTLLSTKNVDLSKASTFKRGANRVTGEDSMYIIIFIPTGSAPHLKTAVDRAIESVPGAIGLVDGVVSQRSWYFIIGESAILVEGTPLIDPALPGAGASLKAGRMVGFFNPNTGKQETKPVDKATFQKIKELVQRQDDAGISKMLLALP